jgi:uncharacterized membrane protein
MGSTNPQRETAGDDPRLTPRLAGVVERNIRALLARREREERRKGFQDRMADRITGFTGSMRFVFLHLALFGGWIVVNVGWTPLPRFDRSFVVLAMLASVEAIFLSTFVLISQNRMQQAADERADLDLQVSLLSEHEVTHLIQLVTAVAERLGVEQSRDPELEELARDVAPEKVLDEMEHQTRSFAGVRRQGER